MMKWLLVLTTVSVSTLFAAAAEAPIRGEVLFQHCSTCHGADGQGKEIGSARFPAIAGLDSWYVENQLSKFLGNVRGAHPADAQGLMMRAMARALRGTNELQAVAAYVQKLPRKPTRANLDGADLARGKEIYANVCVACHGDKMQGNPDPSFRAPSQKPLEPWYMVQQIEKFQKGIRCAHPADAEGAKMSPIMRQVLPDLARQKNVTPEQAVKDVVAYIYSVRDN